MKRIYNYRTNKLYEFETKADLRREDVSDRDDRLTYDDENIYKLWLRVIDIESGDIIEEQEFDEDEYYSIDDALSAADEWVCDNMDEDQCDMMETDREDCAVYCDGETCYVFVACLDGEEPNFEYDEYDSKDPELDDVDFEDEFEDEDDDSNDETKNESVAKRFARLSRLFEADDEEDSEESEDEGSEESEDEGSDDVNSDDEDSADGADDADAENDEDEELTAILITVKTDDVEKCKEELVDANIKEDDIEVLDDNDGETKIRIDANSVMELKDYLATKDIDLEEVIGGELVSDEDDAESEDGADADADGEVDPDAEEDVPDFNIDDLGDIFGAGDESEE